MGLPPSPRSLHPAAHAVHVKRFIADSFVAMTTATTTMKSNNMKPIRRHTIPGEKEGWRWEGGEGDPHMTHHKRFLYHFSPRFNFVSFSMFIFLPLLRSSFSSSSFSRSLVSNLSEIIKNCYLNRMQIGLRFNFF